MQINGNGKTVKLITVGLTTDIKENKYSISHEYAWYRISHDEYA